MLRFNLIKSTWGLFRMGSNTKLDPDKKLFITCVPGKKLFITCLSMTYQIEGRYLPSINFQDSGILGVIFPIMFVFVIFYGFLLVDLYFLFLFFFFHDSSLINQVPISTFLISLWLISSRHTTPWGRPLKVP